MTLGTFQAVKEAPKGASALGKGSDGTGCRVLEDDSGKEGEPERQATDTIQLYHRQSFESAKHKTGGGHWTCSDEFCEYPLLEKLHFHVEVRVDCQRSRD